ncbi:hypothetical protein CARUB_v10015314mg [Capsella rubella]|uniref:S-protein homolog n=1 Tax=Capsella rubella TaxID=81985 RepID=R0HQM7_9BRAS|nr:S-protein homolog 8 [Capsella rubella]EOA32064.1 hypothetical protein CARUB_v10015314mg [Capsella rubella]
MKYRASIHLMVMVLLSLYTEDVIGIGRGRGTVVIYNNMRRGHLLKIRCRSKDDKLGYHVRRSGGNYTWSFKENIFGSTLYWCHLWRGRNFKDHVIIVAYDAKSFSRGWVRWSAKEKGIYESVDGHEPYHFRYSWNGKF